MLLCVRISCLKLCSYLPINMVNYNRIQLNSRVVMLASVDIKYRSFSSTGVWISRLVNEKIE